MVKFNMALEWHRSSVVKSKLDWTEPDQADEVGLVWLENFENTARSDLKNFKLRFGLTWIFSSCGSVRLEKISWCEAEGANGADKSADQIFGLYSHVGGVASVHECRYTSKNAVILLAKI